MKLHKILENTSRKSYLRKKQVECDSCGAINYEEDLRNMPADRHEPGYAVCPDCGHEELSDYTED